MDKVFEKEFIVTDADSAAAVGSGGLNVLATPAMIAFMENVGLTACEPGLADGETTVGMEINVKHLAPTAIGKKIRIKATLVNQLKKIITFHIEAYDGDTLIGEAEHKRAIVSVDKFMANL